MLQFTVINTSDVPTVFVMPLQAFSVGTSDVLAFFMSFYLNPLYRRKGQDVKIFYKFADETITEVEVSEKVGAVCVELDREEYNNNHRETRRHVSFEALNQDNNLFASSDNVEQEIINAEDVLILKEALSTLEPQQYQLILRIFFNGEKAVDIAEEAGVSQAAISKRLS